MIGQVLKRLSSFVGDPSTGWSLEERIAQTLLDKMVQEQIPRDAITYRHVMLTRGWWATVSDTT
jgi:hypothetical protein